MSRTIEREAAMSKVFNFRLTDDDALMLKAAAKMKGTNASYIVRLALIEQGIISSNGLRYTEDLRD